MADSKAGQFVWFEHMVKDVNAAMGFYGEIVGWKTQPFGDNSDYTMWVTSQGPMGGVMKLTAEAEAMGARPSWIGNVRVADVDATCALAKKLGGKVHKEPSSIPTVGRFAVLGDPQGAAFAVFQPTGTMEMHDAEKEGEVCWSELYTSDDKAALAFYGELFGWKQMQEMNMGPNGTYRIYGMDDKQAGGMMTAPKMPDGSTMPSGWLFYFQTKDVDATTERCKKMGATVMVGPMDVPGGGRVSMLFDPQGAMFGIHQNPKKNTKQ